MKDRSVRDPKREHDHGLAGQDGVAYRYSLTLTDRDTVGDILRILREIPVPLCYFLLIPGDAKGTYQAYLGLGSPEVHDLPVRLAAIGVRVRRGEEVRGKGR